MVERTYWNKMGKYQETYDNLAQLIPASGAVANADQNPALERLRRAVNCYYDLFNNGLINRAAEFRKVFGFAGTWIAKQGFPYYEPLEAKMDEFILAAQKEQEAIAKTTGAIEDLEGVVKQSIRYCEQWQREHGEFPNGDGRTLLLKNAKEAIAKMEATHG